MTTVYAVLWLFGLYPLGTAWWANRATSLSHAVGWGFAAWVAWCCALLMGDADALGLEPFRYVALSLTGATGVAVLGARRPHILAWDCVVAGLLAVMLLPLAESLFIGTHHVDTLRVVFLSSTLAVGLLNYLPTRAFPAVLMLALGVAGEVTSLFVPAALPDRGEVQLFHLLMLLTPWGAWACCRGERRASSEFDRLWLVFRDRAGLFWAQRVREQFNNAAANAGWAVHLSWRGLHRTAHGTALLPAEQEAMLETLCAALQRFT